MRMGFFWGGDAIHVVSVPISFTGFSFLRLMKCKETVIHYLRDWNTGR